MSSYKKRQKTLKRTHRERSQIHSRQHLGILEKHKDYVLRAKDYAKKKAQLKALHEKARNRNPDEFYYKMIKTKLKDKRHVIPQEEEKYSAEELQLMKTQDDKYVQMKLAIETKKAERLKSCLHHTKLMQKSPPNSHIIFIDSNEEATRYKQAHETEVREERTKSPKEIASNKSCYKELNQRVQRCKELTRVALKMKTQKELIANKGRRQCIKVKGDSSSNHPAVYKWKQERQK